MSLRFLRHRARQSHIFRLGSNTHTGYRYRFINFVARRPCRETSLKLDHIPEAAEKAPSAIDPVCGMSVDPDAGKPEAVYQGQTYYFCC